MGVGAIGGKQGGGGLTKAVLRRRPEPWVARVSLDASAPAFAGAQQV